MQTNRRGFLKSVIASATAPPLMPSSVLFGTKAPSNQIRVGCIGNGRIGRNDIGNILSSGLKRNARVVAVCDVDKNRMLNAKEKADNFYMGNLPEANGLIVDMIDDYRDLIGRDDNDAVSISVPDCWHAEMAIRAAKAGKDAYLQNTANVHGRGGETPSRSRPWK